MEHADGELEENKEVNSRQTTALTAPVQEPIAQARPLWVIKLPSHFDDFVNSL